MKTKPKNRPPRFIPILLVLALASCYLPAPASPPAVAVSTSPLPSPSSTPSPTPPLTATSTLTPTPPPTATSTLTPTPSPTATSTLTPTPLPLQAFYEAPTQVPARPGVLIRSQPFTEAELPASTQAWRILYTTTLAGNTPALASASVLAPSPRPADPRPVIAWAHGTNGIAQQCAKSLSATPFSGIAGLDQVAAQGWVLVATDYTGEGVKGPFPYIIGEGEARNVLDAVRAARQMPELNLDARTVVWGHSQGGHAALWTGIIAPRYAPDVSLAGIAALAPATDMAAILTKHQMDVGGDTFGSYIATAYSQQYPDVKFSAAVRTPALRFAKQLAALCSSDQANAMRVAMGLSVPVLVDPNHGALGRRLKENIPSQPVSAPLLIAQGLEDTTVDHAITDRYVAQRCAAGQALEYWSYTGLNHLTLVKPDSPLVAELIRWTQARFASQPAPPGCQQKTLQPQAVLTPIPKTPCRPTPCPLK